MRNRDKNIEESARDNTAVCSGIMFVSGKNFCECATDVKIKIMISVRGTFKYVLTENDRAFFLMRRIKKRGAKITFITNVATTTANMYRFFVSQKELQRSSRTTKDCNPYANEAKTFFFLRFRKTMLKNSIPNKICNDDESILTK
jgi:hypothetical protein